VSRSPIFALILVLVVLVGPVLADPPDGYYDTVDLTNSTTLRNSVHDVIDSHTKIPYTSSSTDTWNVLELADQDPLDSSRILDVYRNASYPKYGAGNNDYNREHTWPKSYGFPDDGSSNLPYSDCHMLFLCNDSYNSSRSNNYYDDCASGCTTYSTYSYNGESGVNYRAGAASWQTWDSRKGDVARAQFYADVRYEGDTGSEPDLMLTDNASLIVVTGGNASVAYMGILSTLIEWHNDDPVDDRERNRNDIVYSYQGNRNPFIDHPEWVAGIFLGIVSDVPDATSLEGLRILAVAPNPFNPMTTISYSVPEAGPVRVQVYSMDGRLVRTLVNENRPAGPFEVRWDGRGETGIRAASGTYFVRLVGGDAQDTRPILMLK
jgi:endonuclease I